MKKRLNANTWVVIVLFTIIGLMAVDIGRSMLQQAKADAPPQKIDLKPKFQVGDRAPDFTLQDVKLKKHTFSDLVKASPRDTLLWFTCGCAQCMGVQTYMSKLEKTLGAQAPQMVNVTTMSPDRNDTWIRDTKLKQTILYEPNANEEGSVAMTYKGKPCPRFFRIKPDQTIAKIGESPATHPDMNQMALALAKELGFQTAKEKIAGRPMAPKPDLQSAAPTPSPLTAGPNLNGPERYAPGQAPPSAAAHADHGGDHTGHSH